MLKNKIDQFNFEYEEGSERIQVFRGADPDPVANIQVSKGLDKREFDLEIMWWYNDFGINE